MAKYIYLIHRKSTESPVAIWDNEEDAVADAQKMSYFHGKIHVVVPRALLTKDDKFFVEEVDERTSST